MAQTQVSENPTTYPRTMWYAAKTGNIELLRTIIEDEGAKFYEEDNEFKPPIYYGCSCDHPQVVQYLNELYQANKMELTKEQRDWCIVSCLKGDIRSFLEGKQTIEKVIADRELTLHLQTLSIWDAVVQGQLQRLRYWTRESPAFAILNDEHGKSPLEYAVEKNQVAAAGLLIPLVKSQLEPQRFDELKNQLSAKTTDEMMLRVLSEKASMKEIMIHQKTHAQQ
ncbi:hypothetical protein THRCLA_02552 [Thraustotheca clavata]|uniref:Uncharacterized protein n=1 Tax=Thraustotheca clavata TaxID=74557 RepID=A0A1W0A4S3_9STRA|nr:hypothetical protein THRCLA_02552 [Thraustotheca clavata]